MKSQSETNPKVSIIIPCYNVEEYVGQTLKSVLNQSLREIEIIVVNDGSTDSTLDILKEFEQADDRVKVLDLENGGYGKGVNTGIARARGRYIGIVESDDFIHQEMYEKLYQMTEGETVDVVKGNFYDYYDGGDGLPEAIVNREREQVPVAEEAFNIRKVPEILWGHPSVWSAIYRRDFLSENKIVFQEVKGGGWVDNPFFFETMCKAEKIVWTDEPFYFYRKTNPNSSSLNITNPVLPFERMMDNLDVLDKNNYTDHKTKQMAYSRALMYLRGALLECDYENHYDIINDYAKTLMQRLDDSVMETVFNLHDQYTYNEFASPIKVLQSKQPRILLYNWIPFNNGHGGGGGVTVYCKNVIDTFLREYPNAQIFFLSSGYAYDATTTDISYRKIPNIFGERVQQFEIVNSPIPADQWNIYNNPLVALENEELKTTFKSFIERFGDFTAIHINNIEGLSLDVLDLKKLYPQTKFIFSLHNYIPICVTGFYYMRHKHCNCNPEHSGEDCFACVHTDIGSKFAHQIYERGVYGQDRTKCVSQNRFAKALGIDRLDQTAFADKILLFARTATKKINKNCDHILAVSKRVYDIAASEGFDESKMKVSYIGTNVAKMQVGRSLAHTEDGLKIVFLGNDINYEEKGYPWLLDTLEQLDIKYASKIDLLFTARNTEHAEIYTMCRHFRSVKVIQGYTHNDLRWILEGCHLGIIPVLWEDNLPQIAIEMVAHGVPVLASSAGGASELCEDEMFKFEAGSSDEFLSKLVHFLEYPKDLTKYWEKHSGLITMSEHISELIGYYGLPEKPKNIEITPKDYAYLLKEHDFLKKNISINEERFATATQLEDLRNELRIEKERNIKLEVELKEERMAKFEGKVIFHTNNESIPVEGNLFGARLFKVELEKFDYSDFYIEIKFVKLMNVNKPFSDVLCISGTWHNETGEYKLHILSSEFEKGEKEITEWIYMYVQGNEVYFFGRHPIKYCGFSWEVLLVTSRALHNPVMFENLNSGFINQNELIPKEAFTI